MPKDSRGDDVRFQVIYPYPSGHADLQGNLMVRFLNLFQSRVQIRHLQAGTIPPLKRRLSTLDARRLQRRSFHIDPGLSGSWHTDHAAPLWISSLTLTKAPVALFRLSH